MLISKQIINQLLRYGISLVFIFSGLVKLSDPVGFAWTLEAYFQTFAVDFTPLFLKLLPFCLVFAVIIASVELILGVALLVGLQTRHTLIALLLLTSFFSLLTFYTAILKKLGSCGCFGDVIPLTPWQSFWKSNALLFVLYLLYQQHKTDDLSSRSVIQQWVAVIMAGLCGLGISWYSWWNLPIIDFSLFKTGKDLQQFNGIDFSIWNEKQAITADILKGNQLLIIVQAPEQVDTRTYARLAEVIAQLPDDLSITYLLPFYADRSIIPTEPKAAVAWASPALLKTMLKAKLGFIKLQDGRIMQKGTEWGLVRMRIK